MNSEILQINGSLRKNIGQNYLLFSKYTYTYVCTYGDINTLNKTHMHEHIFYIHINLMIAYLILRFKVRDVKHRFILLNEIKYETIRKKSIPYIIFISVRKIFISINHIPEIASKLKELFMARIYLSLVERVYYISKEVMRNWQPVSLKIVYCVVAN